MTPPLSSQSMNTRSQTSSSLFMDGESPAKRTRLEATNIYETSPIPTSRLSPHATPTTTLLITTKDLQNIPETLRKIMLQERNKRTTDFSPLRLPLPPSPYAAQLVIRSRLTGQNPPPQDRNEQSNYGRESEPNERMKLRYINHSIRSKAVGRTPLPVRQYFRSYLQVRLRTAAGREAEIVARNSLDLRDANEPKVKYKCTVEVPRRRRTKNGSITHSSMIQETGCCVPDFLTQYGIGDIKQSIVKNFPLTPQLRRECAIAEKLKEMKILDGSMLFVCFACPPGRDILQATSYPKPTKALSDLVHANKAQIIAGLPAIENVPLPHHLWIWNATQHIYDRKSRDDVKKLFGENVDPNIAANAALAANDFGVRMTRFMEQKPPIRRTLSFSAQ